LSTEGRVYGNENVAAHVLCPFHRVVVNLDNKLWKSRISISTKLELYTVMGTNFLFLVKL